MLQWGMPAPRPPRPLLAWLRPVTRRANPLMRRLVGRLPSFGVLSYTGRKSGKRYQIPLNAFRRGKTVAFALTYGADVQWVKNVLASGEAELRQRGRTLRLRDPRLIVDRSGRLVPLVVRVFLRLMRVSEYLTMTVDDAPATDAR